MTTTKERIVCYPSEPKIKEDFQIFCRANRMSESQAVEYAIIAFMNYEKNPINQIIGATGAAYWEKVIKTKKNKNGKK